jgi:two-component system, LytTR family, response regulator
MPETTPRRWRALIVDDERLSRQRLKRMLASDAELELLAECRNGAEAQAAIRAHAPDLLFLDIEMPEQDGFAVLDAIEGPCPAIIFVTAHPQYAVRAFETPVLDYLLKPFDERRLASAVARAKARLQQQERADLTAELRSALESARTRGRAPDRIVVRDGDKALLVKVGDVDWIEAESNYVRLHLGKTSHLVRETLSVLEQRLDPKQFRRIHRSTIVNVEAIHELHSWFHGEYRLLLRSGVELKLSRNYKKNVEDLLP